MASYQDLLQRTLGGDTRAFDQVVRRFTGMARALARQRVRDAALAEDAVQEAFLAAFQNLSSLRSLDAFPAWLRSVVLACCAQALRDAPRTIPLEALPGADDLPGCELAPEFDPVEHYARNQTRDMVLSLLASLSGTNREAAVQRYLLGLTHAEIAGNLDLPVGTVKRRLHEARARMAQSLGRQSRDLIRVGYLPISDHLLAMVAHQRQGNAPFRVALRKFLTWSGLVKALVNGALDAAMLMAPLAMTLHNRGAPLFWVLDGHHEGSAITVQSALAARSGSPARTLAGAILGLPHTFSTHGVILRAVLGLGQDGGPGRIHPRYMGPPFMPGPLARRELDGFFCAEPWSLMAEAAGAGKVLLRSRDLAPGHVCCVLAASRSFAAAKPGLLNDYLRLLTAAGDYVHARPHESAAIQSSYTGVDPAAAEAVLVRGYVSFRNLVPDRDRAAETMRLALSAGVLDRPCDLGSLLLPRVA